MSTIDLATLIANLTHPNMLVRATAVRSLVELGSEAQAAIPTLIGALEDSNHAIADLAAVALSRIGASAIPPLLQAAESGPNVRRSLALHILGQYPEFLTQSLSVIASALDDDCPAIRCQAGRTLHTLEADFSERKRPLPAEASGLLKKARIVLFELANGTYPEQMQSARLTLRGMDKVAAERNKNEGVT